ncbi:glycoside hydrolase family 10 protein [Rubrivirga litoralis]|uniref:Family 10 glycosylhydrolase n=1 Tax=Rubrivirga litoralis TaxID=3075598 RepID=A0ABU3BS90_9BACT|nr:family 10 glycosylhydrolase [Rubrivirga sp. F394]MDT0632161.1 family 10 glycosylhydrolase [Rubrivirga sp. F394]
MTLRPAPLVLALAVAVAACGAPPLTPPTPPAAPAPPVAERPPEAPSPPAAPPEAPARPSGVVVDAAALPGPAREFRAAWIATVANIDWPSRSGLSTAQQQAELRSLLDRAVEVGLNAVVFQVRPFADALYFSPYEPWSEVLTGRQGQAPSPWYDPLQFAVDEAHARGLELHAWFNPYRASHPTQRGPRDGQHVSVLRPDLVRTYGDYTWLDPGEPEATDHSMRTILDVVQRYDVDGVHLDDYFYPYPVEKRGRRVSFPDDASYARAVAAGETLGRDDWRRQNVDRFVERLYREVKAEKPHVKVGISPFGIWRPGHPAGVRGFDQYAEIYADARRWLREGWLDYLAPQLYWSIESRGQPFPALLDWWGQQNDRGRHLWPGLYDSRTLPDVGGYEPEQIVRQVRLVRDDAEATGTVHFSMKALLDRYSSLGRNLGTGPYAEPALVPASPWLGATPPAPPAVRVEGGRAVWAQEGSEPVWQWVVRTRTRGAWSWRVVGGGVQSMALPAGAEAVAVSAVSRVGVESPARRVDVARP